MQIHRAAGTRLQKARERLQDLRTDTEQLWIPEAEVDGSRARGRMHPLSGRSRTGSEAPRAYRYRGAPTPEPAAARTREVLALLALQRKMIALRSSRMRGLANELHERVAQAVCDGLKVPAAG